MLSEYIKWLWEPSAIRDKIFCNQIPYREDWLKRKHTIHFNFTFLVKLAAVPFDGLKWKGFLPAHRPTKLCINRISILLRSKGFSKQISSFHAFHKICLSRLGKVGKTKTKKPGVRILNTSKTSTISCHKKKYLRNYISAKSAFH